MKKHISLFLTAMLVLGACGDSQAPQTTASTADMTATPVEPASLNEVQDVVIKSVGDEMKFDTAEFTVKAGTKVKLTLQNVATSPAMQHNVVIMKPNSDANAVGMAGMQAGPDKNYVPASDAVLFSTAIAMPGESKSVEFTAPPAGDYPFICTFPGHYVLMKGVMHSVN
ncbi:MAG: plastocyanin/azurin family copper-binding protein [Rhodothermales bacterium]